jgi:hypothetical protein
VDGGCPDSLVDIIASLDGDGGGESLEKGDVRPVVLLLLLVLHLGGEDGGVSILEVELFGLISFFFYICYIMIVKISLFPSLSSVCNLPSLYRRRRPLSTI